MTYLTAVPAYGRDYKSKKEVQADWDANKDFAVQSFTGGGYINKADAKPGMVINIRYKNLTQVHVVKVK